MRIKIQQFLFGKSHSWSIVGQNIGRELIHLGNNVEFISTDGFKDKYCPDDLRPFIRDQPTGSYDCQVSYTAPHNWPKYLAHGNKNKFGIWNYEYNNKKGAKSNLLQGFGKYAKATTLVLPSSNFSKEIFLNMGVDEEKMRVVPHGINLEDFRDPNPWPLKTKKSKKILLNVAQPHRRKALHLALESFGKAFTKKDDVVLVAKVFKQNKANNNFDIDFDDLYKTFERRFKDHAEVEFIYEYIPNIADIYFACDVNFSATYCEAWHLPSLEALAAGIINVVPNYGGLLDFCSRENSLLINGKVVRAPRNHVYWAYSPFAVHYRISTDDAAEKLQNAVKNTEGLKKKFQKNARATVQKFTWESAAKQILDLCSE